MANNRDAGGRFAGSDDRKPANGDRKPLIDSLHKLFAQAEKAGDYSGASTLARTIAALESNTPQAATTSGSSEENALVTRSATPEEREELRQALVAVRAVKSRILERLGRPPVPKSAIDRPAPLTQWCRRCDGHASFWSADDAKQAAFLIEHFGEQAMREAIEKFDTWEAKR